MQEQRGASTIGILIIILFLGALVTLVAKLGPIYLDDVTIQEAIESLDKTNDLGKMRKDDVRKLIGKRLTVNNVRDFDQKQIKIEKDDDTVLINLEYEKRTNLFRNIDAVVSFDHAYKMKGQ